jgi:hypothetical protein
MANEQITFLEIDEKLYRHERPFYRACAGGTHFTVTSEWVAERKRLTKLWHELNPNHCRISEPKSFLARLLGR